MSDYSWLRNKSPEHKAAIDAKRVGNQNAKKHGLYSMTPPTAACDTCPNTGTCPLFKPGFPCEYVVRDLLEGLDRMEKNFRKSKYFRLETPSAETNLEKN